MLGRDLMGEGVAPKWGVPHDDDDDTYKTPQDRPDLQLRSA